MALRRVKGVKALIRCVNTPLGLSATLERLRLDPRVFGEQTLAARRHAGPRWRSEIRTPSFAYAVQTEEEKKASRGKIIMVPPPPPPPPPAQHRLLINGSSSS